MPLCAATVFDARGRRHAIPELMRALPAVPGRIRRCRCRAWRNLSAPSPEGRRSLSLVDEHRLRRILAPDARRGGVPRRRTASARSPGGTSSTRTSSTWTARTTTSHYLPAESDTGMFGGNSNWRGPVWFPMNLMLIRGLLQLHRYYGDDSRSSARPARVSR